MKKIIRNFRHARAGGTDLRARVVELARRRDAPPDPAARAASGALRSLLKKNPEEALRLASDLAQGELNEFGESALAGLVDGIEPRAALAAFPASRSLVYGMVRRRPSLAASADFWRLARAFSDELIDAIVGARPTKPLLARIIVATLEAEEDARSTRLLELSPETALRAALDWLASKPGLAAELGSGWSRHLERHSALVFDWIADRPDAPLAAVDRMVRNLEPDSKHAREVSLETWMKLSRRLEKDAEPRQFLPLRAFLLSAALDLDAPNAIPLLEQTVPAVHVALAEDRLDSASWGKLEKHLPSIGAWWAWDRCERLRRGAISMLARNGGSLTNLLRDAEAKTIQYITKSCLASAEGRELLHRVI